MTGFQPSFSSVWCSLGITEARASYIAGTGSDITWLVSSPHSPLFGAVRASQKPVLGRRISAESDLFVSPWISIQYGKHTSGIGQWSKHNWKIFKKWLLKIRKKYLKLNMYLSLFLLLCFLCFHHIKYSSHKNIHNWEMNYQVHFLSFIFDSNFTNKVLFLTIC